MFDFKDLSALDRLDGDLAALRAQQQFIRDALAHHGAQSKAPSAGQADPPRAQEAGSGEGTNHIPSAPKSSAAVGLTTEQVFNLAEGPATLRVPANLSPDSCTDLKLRLERFLWEARRRPSQPE
jgi:hypothetical protein